MTNKIEYKCLVCNIIILLPISPTFEKFNIKFPIFKLMTNYPIRRKKCAFIRYCTLYNFMVMKLRNNIILIFLIYINITINKGTFIFVI